MFGCRSDLSFLYIAFFLTLGSFILGFVASWNLKAVYDEWKERAEYAAVVMHPEMQGADGMADPADLLYLRFTEEDDIMEDDE